MFGVAGSRDDAMAVCRAGFDLHGVDAGVGARGRLPHDAGEITDIRPAISTVAHEHAGAHEHDGLSSRNASERAKQFVETPRLMSA